MWELREPMYVTQESLDEVGVCASGRYMYETQESSYSKTSSLRNQPLETQR